ncbi:MAG: HD domain-containing protein [Halarchaeum sp.]
MDSTAAAADAFPELDEIEDDDLRARVVAAWATALEENDVDDVAALPWFPPAQRKHDITGETLVGHVRDVVRGSLALADSLVDSRGADVDCDLVVAAALVHDIGKVYEFDGYDDTAVGRLVGHPYYGVHPVAAAGLPAAYAHVVLSHTDRTPVEPAFLEAVIVKRADEAAAAAIRATALDDLRDA